MKLASGPKSCAKACVTGRAARSMEKDPKRKCMMKAHASLLLDSLEHLGPWLLRRFEAQQTVLQANAQRLRGIE